MGIIKDFKAFISRGNVVDMAVGVIIGGAFGKIVTSLVNDIIMPGIGKLTGGVDLAQLKVVLTPAVLDEAGAVVTPENAILYGNFLATVLDFLIIAACIFLMVRMFTKIKEKFEKPVVEEAPAGPTPAPETELDVLKEIRALLQEKE